MKVYYIHIADFVSINPLNDTYDMEAFDDKSADAIEGKYKRNWLKKRFKMEWHCHLFIVKNEELYYFQFPNLSSQ